jgi:plasmid stability protein
MKYLKGRSQSGVPLRSDFLEWPACRRIYHFYVAHPFAGAGIDRDAIIDCMATLTIRSLDDGVKAKLRVLAASHGRSMEEEAREILKAGVATKHISRRNLADSILRHLAPFGGVKLEALPREPVRRPPDFTK